MSEGFAQTGEEKMRINTALVAHEVVGEQVVVHVLDGYDEGHEVVIDRPASALALIAAAEAFLAANA